MQNAPIADEFKFQGDYIVKKARYFGRHNKLLADLVGIILRCKDKCISYSLFTTMFS